MAWRITFYHREPHDAPGACDVAAAGHACCLLNAASSRMGRGVRAKRNGNDKSGHR